MKTPLCEQELFPADTDMVSVQDFSNFIIYYFYKKFDNGKFLFYRAK